MKLEEEIKQKKFTSEYQKLNLNLIYTTSWIQDQYREVFEKFGITDSQYNVLRILKGNQPNPYTTSQIRERMLDKMSDASRIVDRLFKKEFGLSVSQYIKEKKIDYAKMLLRTTNLSVSEIAQRLGYINLSHFTASFKQITNMTPVNYRKKY